MYREEVDATKGMFRKKREKLQKFEYKLVQPDPADPVTPKVLPKVSGSMLSNFQNEKAICTCKQCCRSRCTFGWSKQKTVLVLTFFHR